jgi:hypothetical protein
MDTKTTANIGTPSTPNASVNVGCWGVGGSDRKGTTVVLGTLHHLHRLASDGAIRFAPARLPIVTGSKVPAAMSPGSETELEQQQVVLSWDVGGQATRDGSKGTPHIFKVNVSWSFNDSIYYCARASKPLRHRSNSSRTRRSLVMPTTLSRRGMKVEDRAAMAIDSTLPLFKTAHSKSMSWWTRGTACTRCCMFPHGLGDSSSNHHDIFVHPLIASYAEQPSQVSISRSHGTPTPSWISSRRTAICSSE